MPVQAQHEQIALVSPHVFHGRPHFVPVNKFGCQGYTFPPSGLLRAGLRVAVVTGGLLTSSVGSARPDSGDSSLRNQNLVKHPGGLLLLRMYFSFAGTRPLLLIRLMDRYNQKPFIGLIGTGQMYDVCAVPPATCETLEIVWMRSYHHNLESYIKLPPDAPATHCPIYM
jgi:hypothetical protein